MTMSQSFDLPGGLSEALAKYREALKETRRELKELEKEAKQSAKTGSIPSDLQNKLGEARGRRDRLENRVEEGKAQKVLDRERAKQVRNEEAEAQKNLSFADKLIYGRSIKSIFGDEFTKMSNSLFEKSKSLSENVKLLNKNPKATSKALDGLKARYPEMFTKKELKTGYDSFVKSMATQAAISKAGSKVTGFIGRALSGQLKKSILASKVSMFGRTTTVGFMGLTAGASLTVGMSIKKILDDRASRAVFAGESALSTAEMYRQFEIANSSLGRKGDLRTGDIMKIAEIQGEKAKQTYRASRSLAGIGYDYLTGASESETSIGDKFASDALKREMQKSRFGEEIVRITSAEYAKKNNKTLWISEMRKEMNWINTGANAYSNWFLRKGGFNEHNIDFTYWGTRLSPAAFFVGSDIDAAEMRASNNIANQNVAALDKAYADMQTMWNNTASTQFALQRIDTHERQRAITAFETDRLSRGLTWGM